MGPPRPRSRSPFPVTVPPSLRRPEGRYSKIDPERIHEELIEQAERRAEEAAELRVENERLKRLALEDENERLRREAERRSSSLLPKPKGGIWIAPGTLATVVSIVLGSGGVATGGIAYWQAERRAEKPMVRTHVVDLNQELGRLRDRATELELRTTDLAARMSERDCWLTSVLQDLHPGLTIRLPKNLTCSEIKATPSIPRRGAKPVITVSEPYPE